MEDLEKFRDLYETYTGMAPANKLAYVPKYYVLDKLKSINPPYGCLRNMVFYNTCIRPKVEWYSTYLCGIMSEKEGKYCLSLNKVKYTSEYYYWDEPYVHVVNPKLVLACITTEQITKVEILDFRDKSFVECIAHDFCMFDLQEIWYLATFFPRLKKIYIAERITNCIKEAAVKEFVEELETIGVETDCRSSPDPEQ